MSEKRAMVIGLDGADPVTVKRLIAEGRLPNIQKVLEQGVSTEGLDMLGVFPTITPPNWCTLATGAWPRTHGISCYLNHTAGMSLDAVQHNWNSQMIQAELIWEAFEKQGKRAIMLNYCEAWPPRVPDSQNVYIDGTGLIPFIRNFCDYEKSITLTDTDAPLQEIPFFLTDEDETRMNCYDADGKPIGEVLQPSSLKELTIAGLFQSPEGGTVLPCNVTYLGNEGEKNGHLPFADRLTAGLKPAVGWSLAPEGAKEATIVVNHGRQVRYVLLSQSVGKAYDTIALYAGKTDTLPLGRASVDQWSDWIYDQYDRQDQTTITGAYKMRIKDIKEDGSGAVFYLSNALNISDHRYFYPEALGEEIFTEVGPMMAPMIIGRHEAFADQLVVESFDQMYDWHIETTQHLLNKYADWSLFYTHLHGIDLVNHWYINEAIEGSHPDYRRHAEVIDRLYEINDKYVGAMLAQLDGDTAIFIVSDHGAMPRDPGYHNPGLGEPTGIDVQVMSKLGYLEVLPVKELPGVWAVDWQKTRAVSQRATYIYLNLKGRDPYGIVEPEDYDSLVQEIISGLYSYRDPVSGDRLVAFAMTREEMECIGLGGEHCGDIFYELTKNFGFEHGNTPNHVQNKGYSVGCLCLMAGSGLKSGVQINRPIRMVDIVPTICQLCRVNQPADVEGGIIYQALAD